MSNIRQASAAVLLITLLSSCGAPPAPERQWAEGNELHYHDGDQFHLWVDTSLPHYHVTFGKFYETHEESPTHYHIARNPRGQPEHVRCFARQLPDGSWLHQPQWRELDRRRKHDGNGIGNWD